MKMDGEFAKSDRIAQHKRKHDIPLDKKFEGEKRYKYKERHNDSEM